MRDEFVIIIIRERGYILSIQAINSQFAPQFNPLQRQAFGNNPSQAANPFAAANPLGQQANSFGSGFGAQQPAQDDISALIAALSAGGASKKADTPKQGGIEQITQLLTQVLGGNKGDKAQATDQAPAAEEAAPADDTAASGGCADADGDGACDSDGMAIEDCQAGNCPDGSCG